MNDPKVPNKYTADEIAHCIINSKYTNDTLFRLVNHIGQVNGQTNHKFITDLILNNWNYICTHGPLLQNLHVITKEHNNWISKLF